MQSVTTQGTTTTNTTNSQNELTGMGSSTLTYDHNGNTTTDDQGHTLVYDAWNRVVAVKSSSGTVIETDSYDGTGRQITQTNAAGTRTDLYYSANWQVIEERQGGNAVAQEVWSPVYVNALLLRDSNTTGNPAVDGLNQRVYAIQDANYNVTALVTKPTGPSTWQVVQRYSYDSYGNQQTMNASWSTTTDAYHWNILFQGGRFDAATNLYTFQNRAYSASMMRWVQNDPMGYVDGANTYQFVESNPTGLADPSGLEGLGIFKSRIQQEMEGGFMGGGGGGRGEGGGGESSGSVSSDGVGSDGIFRGGPYSGDEFAGGSDGTGGKGGTGGGPKSGPTNEPSEPNTPAKNGAESEPDGVIGPRQQLTPNDDGSPYNPPSQAEHYDQETAPPEAPKPAEAKPQAPKPKTPQTAPRANDVKSPNDLPDYRGWPSRPADNGKGTVYTDPTNQGRQVREMDPVQHQGADSTKQSPNGYLRYSDGYGGKAGPFSR